MKSPDFDRAITVVFVTLLTLLAFPAWVAAQQPRTLSTTPRYRLVNLGSLGGNSAGANSMNNRGWASGVSTLHGEQVAHAALWLAGLKLDLGTLGGPNSAIAWPIKNTGGLLVGIAETTMDDPNHEAFSCGTFFGTPPSGKSCLGFRWRNGHMTSLPTLGGNNGYAASANNRGQIVGWAENTTHDSTCLLPQVLQFRAVIWGPKKDQIEELPPFGDDTTSAATAINDQGQVVGISGICYKAVGSFSAIHALLWEDGVPIDLGSLGGKAWNTPAAINQEGDVAGFSDLPGDTDGRLRSHAFLWTQSSGMKDLNVVEGDTFSLAFGINNHGQVVGQSFGASGSHAFLYENGTMTDLNKLVRPSSITPFFANDINDRGEIVGGAIDASGNAVAFMAIPLSDTDELGASASDLSVAQPLRTASPDLIMKQLKLRGIEVDASAFARR